jgi:hypothetical protein
MLDSIFLHFQSGRLGGVYSPLLIKGARGASSFSFRNLENRLPDALPGINLRGSISMAGSAE